MRLHRVRGRGGWPVRAGLVVAVLSLLGPPASPAESREFGQGVGYGQGAETAPITIQVFTSLTCPSCAKLHLETLRPVIGSYVADGRVRLVYCVVPSRRDRLGLLAARCVHAARRLDRSEEVTTTLFSTQRTWMSSGNLEAALAGVLSLEEMQRLGGLMASGELEGELLGEIEAGRQAGVRATPTMLVRHGDTTTPIVGAVSYGILSRYLETVLKDR